MQRIDSATASANENGTGKPGFVGGTFPNTPPTQLTPKWCNQVQEEIANTIAVTKATALSTSVTQLRDGLLARFRGSVVRGMKPFKSLSVDAAINDIIWTEQLQAFVGVGASKAFHSVDGVIWTEATNMVAGTFTSIAFSPSLEKFIAIGNSGVIRQSVDEGTDWSAVTTPPDANNWTSVCWSPELSLFVAVSRNGTNRVSTSPTGAVWTARSASQANSWRSVCWSAELGLFCAVAEDGTNRVMTSPDGINWTNRTSPASLCKWSSVCWSPTLSRFVAVSDDTTGNMTMYSADGITWSANSIGGSENWWKKVSWIPDLLCFVACANQSSNDGADNGSDVALMLSEDGITWKCATAGSGAYIDTFAWSPSLQMLCGYGTHDDPDVNIFLGP